MQKILINIQPHPPKIVQISAVFLILSFTSVQNQTFLSVYASLGKVKMHQARTLQLSITDNMKYIIKIIIFSNYKAHKIAN